MRWTNRFWIPLLLAAVGGMFSQENANVDPRALLMQARSALEGRNLVVRVYQNLEVNPEKFIKVSVPINNSMLQLPAIKAVYPSVSRLSSLFFQTADQTDKTIASALDGSVFLTQYSDDAWYPQWFFGDISKPYNPYWTFLDAQRMPMAGASVEIRITAYGMMPDSPSVLVGHATLDEKGRLKSIVPGGGSIVFAVQHPEYGIASIMYIGAIKNPQGIYVIPLVPKGSKAVAQAVRGTVVNNEGRPVKGAYVRCTPLEPSANPSTPKPQTSVIRFTSGVITDERGRFAFSEPVISEDLASIHPGPAGGRYRLEILPPKSLNLRQLSSQYQSVIQTSNRLAYTLTPMNSAISFHTFAFKHPDSEITRSDELSNIILTLVRDGRQWIRLAYPDFKNGCSLPSGSLRAEINRGDFYLSFPEIEITTGSPKQIVFREPTPITYRGKVIDESTGKPMAGVYVLPNGAVSGDPATWAAQQWQDLQNRADRYAKDKSLGRTSRDSYNQVILTNAEGIFDARLMPRALPVIPTFMALAPGYALASTQLLPTQPAGISGRQAASQLQPDAKGVVEVPIIKMTPLERLYFPTFVFKDENGRAIDPNGFSSANLTIQIDRNGNIVPLGQFLQRKSFRPGIYIVEAKWSGKYYIFEPVDLTTTRPETVIFKPRNMRPLQVIYQGQVIHGLTREPIWGAVVIQGFYGARSDASQLEPEHWEALRSLSSKSNWNNPGVARLQTLFPTTRQDKLQFAVTDREGRFRISVEQGSSSVMDNILAIIAKDFLGIQLNPLNSGIPIPGFLTFNERYKPDQNGVVSLPPLSMPPAATVRLHPVVPDSGTSSNATELRLFWTVEPQDAQNWFPEVEERTMHMMGMTVPKPLLRPNVNQTVYIPAGVSLTLKMMQLTNQSSMLPIDIGPIKLNQGESKEFGHIEFKTAIEILIKAIDEKGSPVSRITITCVDGTHESSASTDSGGTAKPLVTINSSGKIFFSTVDLQTGKRVEKSIPYQVGGPEDAGKTYTLQIPEALLKIYRKII
jgi:hypothetical protein